MKQEPHWLGFIFINKRLSRRNCFCNDFPKASLFKGCSSFDCFVMTRQKAIWAATCQNQQCDCAPSEDSDQPGHPPSLIRVFAVRRKKPWVLSYPLSAHWRLGSDWAVIKIPITSLAGTQCIEPLDGFAYLYQWIYSCRIAGQFTSNFRSRACLTMPSLSGITIYRNTIRPFWDPWSFWPAISVPPFVVLVHIRMTFRPIPLESLRPRLRSFGPLDFSAVFL